MKENKWWQNWTKHVTPKIEKERSQEKLRKGNKKQEWNTGKEFEREKDENSSVEKRIEKTAMTMQIMKN